MNWISVVCLIATLTMSAHAQDELQNRLPKCNTAALSMYFAWVVYAEDLKNRLGSTYSEKTEGPRLANCGQWTISAQYGKLFSHSMVVTNDDKKVAIIAFRGTTSVWDDWRINFDTTLTKCNYVAGVECGQVHSGFHKSYVLMQNDTETHAKKLVEAGYEVILTGHSKGAGFAIMSTLSLANSVNQEQRKHIHNIGFASPLVGDATFVAAFDTTVVNTFQYMTRFQGKMITEIDLVTQIPPYMLGYARTKNGFYVSCNSNYIGNPNTIHALPPAKSDFMRYLPRAVGCHSQQCYLDGMISEKIQEAGVNDFVGIEFEVDSHVQFDIEMKTLMEFMSEMDNKKQRRPHTVEEIEICNIACQRYLFPKRQDDGSCKEICS
jgi:hypothetical protein